MSSIIRSIALHSFSRGENPTMAHLAENVDEVVRRAESDAVAWMEKNFANDTKKYDEAFSIVYSVANAYQEQGCQKGIGLGIQLMVEASACNEGVIK